MVVRVAERARAKRRGARGRRHRRRAHPRRRRPRTASTSVHDARRPSRPAPTASPKPRCSCALPADDDRGQRAGRRAAARAGADPPDGRAARRRSATRRSPPRAIRSTMPREAFNPNVVKVVLDARGYALYFSRATIPWARDAFAARHATRCRRACRCIATSASTPIACRSCALSRRCRRRRSSASRRSSSCARCGTAIASRRHHRRHAGAGRRHAGGPRARARPLRGARLTATREAARIRAAGVIVHPPARRTPPASATITRAIHATDPAGPARRGQRHPGDLHQGGVRHSADLHRRHAARRGQGRHAARARGEEGDGQRRAGLRRHHHRPREGAPARRRLRARATCSTASRARSRRPMR